LSANRRDLIGFPLVRYPLMDGDANRAQGECSSRRKNAGPTSANIAAASHASGWTKPALWNAH